MSHAQFLFVTCQVGAENVCKQHVLAATDQARFAFSRKGCLTFKLGDRPGAVFDAMSINPYARTYGHSLGVIQGDNGKQLAAQVWERATPITTGEEKPKHLHVWERDRAQPGQRGFEPSDTALARSIAETICDACPPELELPRLPRINATARKGQYVIDVVVLEPNEWLVGYHRADTDVQGWPGGLPPLQVAEHVPSRAYLKLSEALKWSKMPIHPGDQIVEIGSAPGGSCQALLDMGLFVIGVDPAEMDEEVLAHRNFEHWRMRGNEIKRKELNGIRWLTCDANLVPDKTLEMVGSLVTHEQTNFRGLMLTIKLPDWKLAAEIPNYIQTVRDWGFKYVKVRQLAYNRQEVCLFALKQKALIRARKKNRSKPRS